jgi:glycosyltransferase involved in cell wall biosynthesis
MDKKYPKVLIIGQNFGNSGGGQITLTNLFRGWPKENIGIVAYRGTLDYINKDICDKYYRIGYNGKSVPFPFFLFLKNKKLGELEVGEAGIAKRYTPKMRNLVITNTLKKIANELLSFFGLYHLVYRITITKDYISWINNFNPDIIYSQLSTLELVRLVNATMDIGDKPLAIHIMDDWPSTINRPGLFCIYWNKIYNSEFHDLLRKASIRLCISDLMCTEYKRRYNYNFTYFHNPIDVGFWIRYSKNNWGISHTFTVLYAGRIGKGTSSSVTDIANSLNLLSKEGININFEIQTSSLSHKVIKKLKTYPNVIINSYLDYKDLPKKLSSVDLLVLPIDFDKNNLKFIKYSMPTKVSEYMITGTPILIYSPIDTALSEYAKQIQCFVVVNHKGDLIDSITQLYSNVELRQKMGQKARKIASYSHDKKIVTENFRKTLTRSN